MPAPGAGIVSCTRSVIAATAPSAAARIAVAALAAFGAAVLILGSAFDGPPAQEAAALPDAGGSWSESLDPAAFGAALFEANCHPCHGMRGFGDGPAAVVVKAPPRDFSKAVFKFGTTRGFPSDEDLFDTVTRGFPAYGMPSFAALPASARQALVEHVKKLTREGYAERLRRAAVAAGDPVDEAEIAAVVAHRMRPGAPIPVPDEPVWRGDDEWLTLGRAQYERQCTACHGAQGRGDGPSAAALKDTWGHSIRPRDHTAGAAQRKRGSTLRDTVRTLLRGIPGTPMPASAADVTTDPGRREVWALARYVDTLRR